MSYTTATALWNRLSTKHAQVLRRAETYCDLTLPHLLRPEGSISDEEASQVSGSFGALALNSLVNKMALAMFAPSRPAFRMELGDDALAKLAGAGADMAEIAKSLSVVEKKAMGGLDKFPLRPKLYQLLSLLAATGNALMVKGDKNLRVMNLRHFAVKRTVTGDIHTLVIKETVCADELDPKVRAALPTDNGGDEALKTLFIVVTRRENGKYDAEQWVDDHKLPDEFHSINKKWDDLPYRVITWRLGDENDYGTGLVEEFARDVFALSQVSESAADLGVQVGEVRWMVNPAGSTDIEVFRNSKNGQVVAGTPDDINTVSAGNVVALQAQLQVMAMWERRIGQAFLLQGATTRNAERVTAEEIRLLAYELETSLGGVYSTLAVSLQKPLAEWLLEFTGAKLSSDLDIAISVITGLDALSRQGDVENLRQAFAVLGTTINLPQQLQDRIKYQPLSAFVGAGFNIDLAPYVMNEQEYGAQLAAQAQARVAEATTTAQGTATA